jgi:hypothetical protein
MKKPGRNPGFIKNFKCLRRLSPKPIQPTISVSENQ